MDPRHLAPVFESSRTSYHLTNLARLPLRLLNPPPAPCKVRSFKISPDFKIELNDILSNQHLPPLALKDFEEYLLFDEMTAENLYFVLWARNYTEEYHKIVTSSSPDFNELHARITRAVQTFFDPNSPLALNLPQNITSAIISLAECRLLLHPDAFDPAVEHVSDLLRASLQAFVRRCCGNATRNRSWFSIFLAIAAIVQGLAVILGSILFGWNKMLRFLAYPLFLVGFTSLFAGMHGLCMIIYTFAADARQLYPYEVIELDSTSTLVLSTSSLSTLGADAPPVSSFVTSVQHAIDSSTPVEEKDGMFPSSVEHQRIGSSGAISSAPFIPSRSDSSSAPVLFDFDSLPFPQHKRESFDVQSRRRSSSGATFASLTKVLNPIVVRSQWEIAARSMMVSFVLSTALMVGLAFVPNFVKSH